MDRKRIRSFIDRRKWWILVAAAAIKLVHAMASRNVLARLGDFGGLLSGLATAVLVVAAVWLLRWVGRKYLFAVSRRLGLAFVFVGVVPLLFFAILVVCVGALGIVNLSGREAREVVGTLADRSADESVRARDALVAALASDRNRELSEWRTVVGPDGRVRRLFAWCGAAAGSWETPSLEPRPRVPGGTGQTASLPSPSGTWDPQGFLRGEITGTPPSWMRTTRFSGLVAAGDSLLLIGSCSGILADGRPYVVVALEPFDDRVATFVSDATGTRAKLLPWSLLGGPIMRPDSTGPSPAWGSGDSAHAGVVEPLRTEATETPASSDSLELSLGLKFDEGFRGHSLMMAPVLEWRTGLPLESSSEGPGGLRDLPLLRIDFDAKSYLSERFLGGGKRGWMWLAIKVLGIAMFSMMLGAIAIGVRLTASVTKAVNALDKGTRRIREGDLDHRIVVKSNDQLGALAASFNDMTRSVTDLLEEKKDREQLEHEMEIAASVQRTMLPDRFPMIPGLEGMGFCLMAKQVGGDLYDFIPVGTDRLGVLVGDVSGKGVSSALVMSNVVSSVRSLASLPVPPGPAELLARLNTVLYQTTVADCFVTVFYAEYDFRTGLLRYSNAGHNWPLVFDASGEVVASLDAGGLMLGIAPEIHLVEREVQLDTGQVVLAYSDGLVDAVSPGGEPFEIERIRTAVRGQTGRSPRQIADTLAETLQAFRGSAEEVDDITMVILKRVPLPVVAARPDGVRS